MQDLTPDFVSRNARVERQLLLNVVRTEPGAVVGKTRVGFDQNMGVDRRIDGVQAAGGQGLSRARPRFPFFWFWGLLSGRP